MMTPYLCSGMMLVTILACNGLLADYCAGARRALAVRFSQACGQNMFGLSYETVLGAVRACCDAGEATLEWLAAATGAGTRLSHNAGMDSCPYIHHAHIHHAHIHRAHIYRAHILMFTTITARRQAGAALCAPQLLRGAPLALGAPGRRVAWSRAGVGGHAATERVPPRTGRAASPAGHGGVHI